METSQLICCVNQLKATLALTGLIQSGVIKKWSYFFSYMKLLKESMDEQIKLKILAFICF